MKQEGLIERIDDIVSYLCLKVEKQKIINDNYGFTISLDLSRPVEDKVEAKNVIWIFRELTSAKRFSIQKINHQFDFNNLRLHLYCSLYTTIPLMPIVERFNLNTVLSHNFVEVIEENDPFNGTVFNSMSYIAICSKCDMRAIGNRVDNNLFHAFLGGEIYTCSEYIMKDVIG